MTGLSNNIRPLIASLVLFVTLSAIAWGVLLWLENNSAAKTHEDAQKHALQTSLNIEQLITLQIARISTTSLNASNLPNISALGFISHQQIDNSALLKKDYSYAAIDMVRRAFKSQKQQDLEVHRPLSDNPYIGIALPGKVNNQSGVIFAHWSSSVIKQSLTTIDTTTINNMWITQGDDSGLVLAEHLSIDKSYKHYSLPINGSIWTLHYQPQKTQTSQQQVIIASVLVLVLSLIFSLRIFHRYRPQPSVSIKTEKQPKAAKKTIKPDTIMDSAANANAPGLSVEVISSSEENIPAAIFRAYDIRGKVGSALTKENTLLIGRAIGVLSIEKKENTVLVARDARHSSKELSEALITGLRDSNCNVIDLGQAPTPALYFALNQEKASSGVVVTASHNPADYNGFKITIANKPLDGDALQQLKQSAQTIESQHGTGRLENFDISNEYVNLIDQHINLKRPLKIVVDSGNGVACKLATALFEKLGCEVINLYCEPDGSFPNHSADPSRPENLVDLQKHVIQHQADMGIALDGDGDRLGVIDNLGQVVVADHIIMLLAEDILQRQPGADIVYDVKSSSHINTRVLAAGGSPVMWQSGHTRMKKKMRETGALLGGEFSGHFFIKDRWSGYDDGLYAGARMLEIVANQDNNLSTLVQELPKILASHEYLLKTKEGAQFALMRAIAAHASFDDARIVDIDGLRVEFRYGWGLIRASNTTPALSFRFEAEDKETLANIKQRFRELLKQVAPELSLPF